MNKITMAKMMVSGNWDWFPAKVHAGRNGAKYARRIRATGAVAKKPVEVRHTITINDHGNLSDNRKLANMEHDLKLARREKEAA